MSFSYISNMNKFVFCTLNLAVLFFAACGDDSSSATRPSDESSSSVALSSSSTLSVTGNLLDSRDGQSYKTVVIGSQTWMAENLNYETANSYCYNDSAKYCDKYGRLYTWAAAMDSAGTWSSNGKGCGVFETCSPTYPVRGACPSGWHLPTKAEFETLFTTVGGQSTVGIMLKSTSGWNNGCNGTDAYSFSALPAGFREIFGMGYDSEGYRADYWSSTDDNNGWNGYAYHMGLYDSRDGAFLDLDLKNSGYSVRCVKDL